MNKNNKSYNIYDIAEELGLAPSTISKAINGTGAVSKATKERILNFIREKGYSPNVAAKSLKSKSNLSIGILYPTYFYDLTSHFFFSKVIENFRSHIERNGYEFTYVTHYLGNTEVSFLDYCTCRNLDGVLILGATSKDEDVMEVANSNIPKVSIDYLKDGIPFIQTNDIMAADKIASFIKEKAFKKIVYLTGPYERGDFKKRTDTFINIAKLKGLKIENEQIFESKESTVEEARDAIIDLFTNHLNDELSNVDCIVTSNDEMAMGVIYGLESLGIKVPTDVSVIGFDDMYFAKYFNPPLTTVAQDVASIGKLAAERLISIIKNEDKIIQETFVDCDLIVRKSTR